MPERRQYTILKDFNSVQEAQAWGDRYLKPQIDLLVMPIDCTRCPDGAVVKVQTEPITETQFQALSAALGLNSSPKLVINPPAPAAPTPTARAVPPSSVVPKPQKAWWKVW